MTNLDSVLADYMRWVDASEQIGLEISIAAFLRPAAELRQYFFQASAMEQIFASSVAADFTGMVTPHKVLCFSFQALSSLLLRWATERSGERELPRCPVNKVVASLPD